MAVLNGVDGNPSVIYLNGQEVGQFCDTLSWKESRKTNAFQPFGSQWEIKRSGTRSASVDLKGAYDQALRVQMNTLLGNTSAITVSGYFGGNVVGQHCLVFPAFVTDFSVDDTSSDMIKFSSTLDVSGSVTDLTITASGFTQL